MDSSVFRTLRRILGWARTPEEEEQALRARQELRQEEERRAIDEAELRTRISQRR